MVQGKNKPATVNFSEPTQCKHCGYDHFFGDSKTCFDCRSCDLRIDQMAERSLTGTIVFLEQKLATLKAACITEAKAAS